MVEKPDDITNFIRLTNYNNCQKHYMGENKIRLFVNLLYDFKKNEKFPELFAKLRGVLAENGWEQQRLLFDFHDVNDTKTEGKTPHAMLMKTFPQLAPYWRSAFEEHKALHPYEKPLPPEHSYSYLSNFPGRKAGKPVFSAPDTAVDLALMERVFAKVPRPYPFYSALAVLDGIDWSKGCDLSPAMDWVVIYGKGEEDWDAGYWPDGMDFDEICPFYQSNSVRIGKDWDLAPELAVQIEVFPGKGLALASKVEEAFSEYFGMPTKRYARAVSSWEEREDCRKKTREMREFFACWSRKMQLEALRRQAQEKEKPSDGKRTVSRAALQKRFYEKNALTRYPLSRWDDKCCRRKRLAHNYHLEVGIAVNSAPPVPGEHRNSLNCLYVECIGWNFELCGNLEVQDFAVKGSGTAGAGDPAGKLAFTLWQEYLDRFEAEVVPELFRIFGETPEEFVCDSRRMMRANEETIGTGYVRF